MHSNSQELFKQAFNHLKQGDARMAANTCRFALKKYPNNVNFLCLISRASIVLKLFKDAQKYLDKATKIDPKSAIARETYGDLLLAKNKPKEALREYEFAFKIYPDREQLKQKINFSKNKITPPSLNKVKKNETRNKDDGKIKEVLEHLEAGRSDNAENILRQILKNDPNHVEAARLLAGVAMDHDRFRDAEVFLSRVVKNAPNYVRAWMDLLKSQREQDKYKEALISAEKLIELEPGIAQPHMMMGGVKGLAGDHQGAINSYKKAIRLSPEKSAAFCSMAHHLKTIGKQDEAINAYREAIKLDSTHTESYWSLANLKTFKFMDNELKTMEKLLKKNDLPDDGKVHIHNALGLEYEARKDFKKSFKNMSQCNAIRRKMETYDPVEFETMIEKIMELFSNNSEKNLDLIDQSVTPIFIVGLPRSGSTLIEQIIASHSLVEGTHELHELTTSMRTIRNKSKIKTRFPDALSEFKSEHWRMLGDEYLSSTEKYRTGKKYFIDKNPNNFIFTGALRFAIPNCKIINARRHPLDSCYGSFKQLFASGQPFSYDLIELGEYYLEYDRLMSHWDEVFPGFVLDVKYENVVSNLENEVKRIIDFCGLPYEESCLRFHETERAVKTASSEQVRKPIYSSSVNLWRNYEENLSDLIEILEPLINQLPKNDRPTGY